jgi:hypothetical protein
MDGHCSLKSAGDVNDCTPLSPLSFWWIPSSLRQISSASAFDFLSRVTSSTIQYMYGGLGSKVPLVKRSRSSNLRKVLCKPNFRVRCQVFDSSYWSLIPGVSVRPSTVSSILKPEKTEVALSPDFKDGIVCDFVRRFDLTVSLQVDTIGSHPYIHRKR